MLNKQKKNIENNNYTLILSLCHRIKLCYKHFRVFHVLFKVMTHILKCVC